MSTLHSYNPFIVRFAIDIPVINAVLSPLKYVTSSELTFIEYRNILAIDDVQISYETTGTIATKAQVDPTKDEPADR
jgi:hypothetical protein